MPTGQIWRSCVSSSPMSQSSSIVARRVLVDQALDHALHLVAGDLGDVAPLEDLAAVFVDDAALLVHHVVVLEHPFADQEVLLLDLLLGVLDRLGEHLRLQRHLARPRRRPARGGRGSCRCGRRRRGGSRRLRRRGRSASRRGRPGGRSGRAAGCRCGATRGARCRRCRGRPARALPRPRPCTAGSSSATFASSASCVALVAGVDALLLQLVDRQVLGVAAELDVDPAARHVGGDHHRALAARLGDQLALSFGVLGLGVQHRVLDPVALQLARRSSPRPRPRRCRPGSAGPSRGGRRSRPAPPSTCRLWF